LKSEKENLERQNSNNKNIFLGILKYKNIYHDLQKDFPYNEKQLLQLQIITNQVSTQHAQTFIHNNMQKVGKLMYGCIIRHIVLKKIF